MRTNRIFFFVDLLKSIINVINMEDSVKKEYLIIANKYHEVIRGFGNYAPHLSNQFKIISTIECLKKDCGIFVCRTTVYTALRLYPKLKKEEPFLIND